MADACRAAARLLARLPGRGRLPRTGQQQGRLARMAAVAGRVGRARAMWGSVAFFRRRPGRDTPRQGAADMPLPSSSGKRAFPAVQAAAVRPRGGRGGAGTPAAIRDGRDCRPPPPATMRRRARKRAYPRLQRPDGAGMRPAVALSRRAVSGSVRVPQGQPAAPVPHPAPPGAGPARRGTGQVTAIIPPFTRPAGDRTDPARVRHTRRAPGCTSPALSRGRPRVVPRIVPQAPAMTARMSAIIARNGSTPRKPSPVLTRTAREPVPGTVPGTGQAGSRPARFLRPDGAAGRFARALPDRQPAGRHTVTIPRAAMPGLPVARAVRGGTVPVAGGPARPRRPGLIPHVARVRGVAPLRVPPPGAVMRGRPPFINPAPVERAGSIPPVPRGDRPPVVQVTIPVTLDHQAVGQAMARIDTAAARHELRATGTAPDVIRYPQMPGRAVGI
ncbi:hypothetical protein CFR80_12015 [Komagataeibacter oboediens]|uniref:Uncharacterized protein n=1 Tax=Komagataeibacter oboediens TaxID=65958 RepID=A0A318QTU9_9PROT|nr:hypothetical protein [Komagataeibacter oboediens]PYD81384.1 hypothetical protein CFR80_12015 [Komagataeibacter oboediens]